MSTPLVHPSSVRDSRRPRRGGFALLITITLVAFLVLIVIALASLTRVETRVANNSQTQAQARQNALMALNIAIGQLQKHTGPDQRVTAPADIILPAGVTVTPPTFNFGTGTSGGKFTSPGSTGAEVLADVDAYWSSSATPRNRHWIGAWRNTNTTTYDRDNPSAFNPAPGRFVDDDPSKPELRPVWLVSGGESDEDPSPSAIISGLTASTSALDDTLRDSTTNTTHRLLVGSATTAADPRHYVTAPQVPIQGTVPGQTGEVEIGHYAWWIGDEGVKARADIIDPFGAFAGTVPTSPAAERNIKRRLSAQRPVIEAMTDNGHDGLADHFADLSADPRLGGLLHHTQLGLLDDDADFRAQLGARYHDLSVSSRGVLADTRHGGLKRDLSFILSRSTLPAFRSALETADFDVAPSLNWNPALASASTPYATIPSNESSGRAYDAGGGILGASSTWEQLWSFYNMGEPAPLGVFSGGVAAARPSSGTQQGLYPVLVQAKLFYSMQVTGGAITLRVTPVAVLANPYNVTIGGDFILSFGLSPVVLTGKLGDPHPDADDLTYNKTGSSGENAFVPIGNLADATIDNGGLGQATLLLKAPAIAPGVAQIFTVDPGQTVNGPADKVELTMGNTFDPSAYVTYVTGLSIDTAGGDTHASLYASGLSAQLHMIDASDDLNRIGSIATKSPASSTGAPIRSGFMVYPLVEGYHRGGGVFFALQDGKSDPQQAMFYQVNYRTLVATYLGTSAYGDHPLQWGVSYGIRGLDGDTDTSPHPLLSANILPPLDEDIPATTRWGFVASGEYPSLNTVPPEVTDPRASLVNLLYDIPSPGHAITSIGQLQHFNLAGHFSDPTAGESLKTNGFLVNYPIANSYPGPRVPRHKVFHSSAPFSHHYDASYLWNDLLWDRFTFSSYPSTGSFTFGDDGDGHLVNSRYRPFRPESEVAHDDESAFRGVFAPARNLLVKGAFNINSTSVDAWKALFSALKGVPTGTDPSPAAPYARTLSPAAGSASARDGVSTDAWSGFNDLTQDEINELAEEMVLQVRLRGPFLSLSEFVNRRLAPGPTSASNTGHPDPYRLGLSGALQAAIDRTINRKAAVPSPYDLAPKRNEGAGTLDGTGALRGLYLGDLEYRMHNRLAGHPGYLLQGDVLSVIGPNLTARSDTFTIRTYGDTRNLVTGDIDGRVWCEAVVQRVPDYLVPASAGGDDPEDTPAAGSVNERLGRRYQIIAFRWLSPAEI